MSTLTSLFGFLEVPNLLSILMELAFSVAWGPLSQIAVPLIDVNSAVQLAVGAYGWWKARERCMSLVEMVNANGGRLAPSISFNIKRYLTACQSSEFRGIAWFEGRLESVPLPNASTWKMGDTGVICLRAVTTALLALYDVDSTSAVLAHIIPRCLINYDVTDNEHVPPSGSFLASVRQFVSAVAAEDHCNTMRKKLISQVDDAYHKLFSVSAGGFRIEDVREVEVPIIIGLLEWVLTSPFKRITDRYSTRSLTAWCLAVALFNVGFDVHSSSQLIVSHSLYDQISSPGQAFPPTVFLVTCSDRETDHMTPTPGITQTTKTSLSPRITSINAIPQVIFRHLRHENQSISVERLWEIWNDSFEHASAVIGRARPIVRGMSQETLDYICEDTNTNAVVEPVVLIGDYDTTEGIAGRDGEVGSDSTAGFVKAVIPQLSKYLPDHDWTTQEWYKNHELFNWTDYSNISENAPKYIFIAVVLATAYAVSCNSLRSDTEGQTSGSHVEVAIYPDLLCKGKRAWLTQLLTDFRDILGVKGDHHLGVPLESWTRFLFRMYTGELERPLEGATLGVGSTAGYQANGIFVVMDMLLHPSLNPRSFLEFHIRQGQPLQFPVTDLGFVVAGVDDNKREHGRVDVKTAEFPVATTLKSQESDRKPRVDLEPHWESDPRRVVFRARIDGVLKCSFSPTLLIFQLGHFKDASKALKSETYIVSCECNEPSSECSVPESERWKIVELSQLLDSDATSSSSHVDRSFFPVYDGLARQHDPLFIRAARDTVAQVLCCAMFWGLPRFVAVKCIKCAYNQWSKRMQVSRDRGSWDMELASGTVLIDATSF